MEPTFSGELQLAGWSESHTGGCKVTFWLSGPDELAAFRTLTVRKGNTAGQRFMAALVEVGDDELPVPPPSVKESLTPETPKGGALAKLAGMWCADKTFQAWLELDPDNAAPNESGATLCLYALCEIESRRELDHDPAAAERFNQLIRGPYMKWRASKGLA